MKRKKEILKILFEGEIEYLSLSWNFIEQGNQFNFEFNIK